MTIQAGDRLPDVPLSLAGPDGPQPTTSSNLGPPSRYSRSRARSPRPARPATCRPMSKRPGS